MTTTSRASLVSLLLFLFRSFRQWFLDGLARQHLVAHGGVVDESRDNYGGLLQVFWLQPVIHVHVRVVCAGFVIERILNELESWDADGIKRQVIGATGVAHGDSGHAQIFEGLHPGFENGS